MKGHLIAVACLLAVIAAVSGDESAPVGAPHEQRPFLRPQPQPGRPLPYPLRRQSSGLDRARQAISGFMQNIMDAGRRFRRMASARLFTMFNRRSLRRSQRQQVRTPFRQQ
ncbi:uncharacterized protein LOC119092016 [Pollicipes pollicipes]|uniref:uncharacterized protein LOC119092016 n=1 Tax=Pollicipes pollicipes TaxID=41117 RepID=UPI0018858B41|nr:uncharacterized protein LOC119092016 [Pollicipes pollicipes]